MNLQLPTVTLYHTTTLPNCYVCYVLNKDFRYCV